MRCPQSLPRHPIAPGLLALVVLTALSGCAERATEAPRETDEAEPVVVQPAQPKRPQPEPAHPEPGFAAEPTVALDAIVAGQGPSGQASLEPRPEARLATPGHRQLAVRSMGLAHTSAKQRQRHMEEMGLPHTLPLDRERYQDRDPNGIQQRAQQPFSTFSIDVDTASYANVRRLLNQGQLPRHDAVRPEEMVNYFSYPSLPQPQGDHPFGVTTQVSPSPWNADTHLMRVSLQGEALARDTLPPANLVFLVDVSGSMQSADKLPLLQRSLKLLLDSLDSQDRIALVTYAGSAGVVLPSTPGDQHATIAQAIDNLRAGGATHGSAGIRLAYQLAAQHRVPGGINRVILASDGDLNVGTVNLEALKELVGRQREQGIALTTLGFGSGNYNDELMEQLADIGDGNAAYIDSLLEARKVLVAERGSTLHTIAKNVKIQIEFSSLVKEYRLIGYENRLLEQEDFRNDKVDAGEIGAGHSVTALYELTLSGQPGAHPERRYSHKAQTDAGVATDELAYVRLRYLSPGKECGKESCAKELGQPVMRDIIRPLAQQDTDFRWAAAVAAFAQQLQGGKHLGQYGYDEILALAQGAKGTDPQGYRAEMTQLVQLARSLTPQTAAITGPQ